MVSGLPVGLVGDLERHGIGAPVDLAALLDLVVRRGFGYALQGASWRTPLPHEANVYRRGGTMTKREGTTLEIALASALVAALDAEAGMTEPAETASGA